MRYLDCGAFGPQRAALFDGDWNNISNCGVPLTEPRSTMEEIQGMLEFNSIPTVLYHESDLCHDWTTANDMVISLFSEGVSELVGMGYWTSRGFLPGGYLQNDYDPRFLIADVPYPQLFVGEFFACQSGEEDTGHNLANPLIVEALMTSDPDLYPVAVAWIGNRRGGFLQDHMRLGKRYFEDKLTANGTETIQKVLFDTVRELGVEYPSMKSHLLLTTMFGWPTWLGARCVPPSMVQAHASTPSNSSVVAACPKGDAAKVIVSIDFDDELTPRSFDANEMTLNSNDFASEVYDDDGVLSASTGASGPSYTTTIEHAYFGGFGTEAVEVLLNGYPLAQPAEFVVRTPDLSGDGLVNVVDFASFTSGSCCGNSHYPVNPASDDPRDFNNDHKVDFVDFAFFGQHNTHVTLYGPAARIAVSSSTAGVALSIAEEYPTATTHRLYVDIEATNLSDVDAALFALDVANTRLASPSWNPETSLDATVLFAPIDEGKQFCIGLKLNSNAAESTMRLGRITFDVMGQEPLELSDVDFSLVSGEVLLASNLGTNVAAQMIGTLTRTLDPKVARIYHNRLEQNFPNPFNPTTTLAFSLSSAAKVRLTIYDVSGGQVRGLLDKAMERGAYRLVWDGRNDAGEMVASGIYFCRLDAGAFSKTRKSDNAEIAEHPLPDSIRPN